MSGDASASPPPALHAECAVLRDASLSDGGETTDTVSVSLESMREQLRRMQLRLAESESAAASLVSERDCMEEQFSANLAHLQNEHAHAMHTLESSLRAEVRAPERRVGHLWACVGSTNCLGAWFPFSATRTPRPKTGPAAAALQQALGAPGAGRCAPRRGCRPRRRPRLGPST